MKKHYMKPAMVQAQVTMQPLMAVSGNGIGYGGLDDGTNPPTSRHRNRLWNNEEDDL